MYKVTIQKITNDRGGVDVKEVYLQTVDTLDVKRVVDAVNAKCEPISNLLRRHSDHEFLTKRDE